MIRSLEPGGLYIKLVFNQGLTVVVPQRVPFFGFVQVKVWDLKCGNASQKDEIKIPKGGPIKLYVGKLDWHNFAIMRTMNTI